MAQDILDTAVRFVKGVGEVRAAQLNRLDIHTVRDLLFTLSLIHISEPTRPY